MAAPPGVERLARMWMVPEDSVSIFSAANMADEIRRKHNAFVQAVVTKVSNLEKEVKRTTSLGARGPEVPDLPEEPETSPEDLGRIVVLESKVEALLEENEHLAMRISAGVSKRDNAEMLNKLYFLKRENDSLNERQEALEDQMEQLMKTVGDMADRATKDKEQVQSSTKALAEARAEIGRLRDRVRVLEHDHNIPRPAMQQMSISETQQRIDFHDSRIRWLESSLSKKK